MTSTSNAGRAARMRSTTVAIVAASFSAGTTARYREGDGMRSSVETSRSRGVAWRRAGGGKDSLCPRRLTLPPTRRPTMLLAVTFDFWNTVMWEEPGSLEGQPLGWLVGRAAGRRRARRSSAPTTPPTRATSTPGGPAAQYPRRGRRRARSALLAGDAARSEELLLEGYDEAGRRAAVHPSDGVARVPARRSGMRACASAIVCDIGLTPSHRRARAARPRGPARASSTTWRSPTRSATTSRRPRSSSTRSPASAAAPAARRTSATAAAPTSAGAQAARHDARSATTARLRRRRPRTCREADARDRGPRASSRALLGVAATTMPPAARRHGRPLRARRPRCSARGGGDRRGGRAPRRRRASRRAVDLLAAARATSRPSAPARRGSSPARSPRR